MERRGAAAEARAGPRGAVVMEPWDAAAARGEAVRDAAVVVARAGL